jgi:hypothetical protein
VNGWEGFGFFTIFAFAISGSNTSTVFGNGSLPAFETTTVAASGSTSNANDLVFAAYSDGVGVGTAGTGWTQILDNFLSFSVEYQVAFSTGSFTGNLSPNNNNSIVGVLDAVMQASGGGPSCKGNLSLLGVGCRSDDSGFCHNAKII